MPTTPPQRPRQTASERHSPQWLQPESRPPNPVTAPPSRMLWRYCGSLRRSARRARHCSSHCATNSPYLLQTFPSPEPSDGMGRTLGASPRHAWRTVPSTAATTPLAGTTRTPARSPQGQGRRPGRRPRQAPYPTVYFPQCPTTAPPRFGEKTTTSTISCGCTLPLLVPIKGGGGLYLGRRGFTCT